MPTPIPVTPPPGTIIIVITPRNPKVVALDVTSAITEDAVREVLGRTVNPRGWSVSVQRHAAPAWFWGRSKKDDVGILRKHAAQQQALADDGSTTAAHEVRVAHAGLWAYAVQP